MEPLVRFFSRKLPALFGGVLVIPLVRTYYPEIFDLIKIDNIHVFLAIGIWLIVYEIVIVHVLTPIVGVFFSGLALYVRGYELWLKVLPKEKRIQSLVRFKNKINNKPIREIVAIELIQQRVSTTESIDSRYARELAITLGNNEYEKKSENDDRGSSFALELSLATLIFGLIYLIYPPELSPYLESTLFVSFGLILSSLLSFILGVILDSIESEEKFNLVVLKLSNLINEEK